MKYKYNIKTLTQYQYDMLNRIASRTGCDCWFDIRQKRNGTDYVRDLEFNKRWCLRSGIKFLIEAIDDPDIYLNCSLDYIEEFALWDLCRYLEIKLPYYLQQPDIHKGISSKEFVNMLQEAQIDYDIMLDDEDSIRCQDYVFQFDKDGILFDIVNLFYVEVR